MKLHVYMSKKHRKNKYYECLYDRFYLMKTGAHAVCSNFVDGSQFEINLLEYFCFFHSGF